ncbi:MAG: lipopolysaccharide heptosyltransferase I [Rhizobiaceae bacterium]
MRLLVVKTSSMGDVIHTLPAVTDALAALPGLEVGWAVEKPFAPLVRLHPGIRRVHEVELRRWRGRALFASEARKARSIWKSELKSAGYDRVIDAQGLMKSAFLARMAGAPIDGLSFSSIREWPAALAYHRRHAVRRDLHAVTRVRTLFGAALGYSPGLDVVNFGIAGAPSSGADTAFLLHGTSWRTKEWPLANWIAIARALAERGMKPVATWSDGRELATVEAIAAATPLEIVPRTGLGEIADQICKAGLAIGVDTGLTHLAAALGVPTVALYVASRPGLTGPVGARTTALVADGLPETGFASRTGASADAASITPAMVLDAAATLLGREGSATSGA